MSGHETTFLGEPPSTTVAIAREDNYANASRENWRQIRNMTKDAYGFPSVADLDARVNIAAERFKDDQGRWPTAFELWGDDSYRRSVEVLAAGYPFLPPLFGFTGDDGGTQWVVNDPINGPRSASVGSLLAGTGGFLDLPNLTRFDDLQATLASLSPIRAPGVGSGRSGGAGRAPIVFDEAELTEGARERWRGMLLEEPDDDVVSGVVKDYVNDASAFWMKQGGRRDFDTFVVDRIRQQVRYSTLYARKPGFQSETEYLSGFRQAAGSLGLSGATTLREVEAGATTGVGLAGFTERLSGIREARVANAGAFSQRLAASAAQTGLSQT